MRIRIEVCPDRRLFAAAEAYVLGPRRVNRRLLALGPIVVGTLLLFVGVGAWLFAGALIAMGIVEVTLLPWLQARLGARWRVRGSRHPRLVEVHEGGVRCIAGPYDTDRPWAVFERIVELPGQYLLLLDRQHYVCVPTDGLSGEQLAELRALIARRAPATA